jgi:lysophospholipase L1-like esterase
MSIRHGVLLASASLGLALLCAELGARALEGLGHYSPKRPVPLYMQPNPFLYSALRPGSETRLPGSAQVDVNSLGFRGDEIAPRKPEGVFRIVALGGSTTFGYHNSIPSTEETWPYKLERELRQRFPDRSIEVVNAGVPGYTLRNSLINFVARVTWLEPDLIIVYHGVNDASAFRSHEQLVRSVIDADITQAHPIGLVEQTLARSYVFLDVRYRARKLWRRLAAASPAPHTDAPESPPVPSRSEPRPATLAAYERHLRQLVLVAHAAGTEVALVRQAIVTPPDCATPAQLPDPDEARLRELICIQLATYYRHLDARGLAETLEGFARIQRSVAAEYGLAWIDADAAVPDSAEFHSDLCHFRPAGTTRVAEAIAEGLTQWIAQADLVAGTSAAR